MNRWVFGLMLGCFSLGWAAVAGDESSGGLLGKVAEKLGVSEAQAEGGVGSIFSYAKELLGEDEFGVLGEHVPGMEALLEAAPEVDDESGGLSSMLGGDAKKVLATKMLEKRFKKLGLDSDLIADYLPIVLGYLQEKGGDKVSKLLGKLFD